MSRAVKYISNFTSSELVWLKKWIIKANDGYCEENEKIRKICSYVTAHMTVIWYNNVKK